MEAEDDGSRSPRLRMPHAVNSRRSGARPCGVPSRSQPVEPPAKGFATMGFLALGYGCRDNGLLFAFNAHM